MRSPAPHPCEVRDASFLVPRGWRRFRFWRWLLRLRLAGLRAGDRRVGRLVRGVRRLVRRVGGHCGGWVADAEGLGKMKTKLLPGELLEFVRVRELEAARGHLGHARGELTERLRVGVIVF